MPNSPLFHTVQVQYDPETEYWWVHYLDVMGWPQETPRYFQFEKQATDHAEGIYYRRNADHYVKFKADGEQELSRSRIRAVNS